MKIVLSKNLSDYGGYHSKCYQQFTVVSKVYREGNATVETDGPVDNTKK